MKPADVHLLNGFLEEIERANTVSDLNYEYLIEPMERKATLNESLESHFAQYFAWLASKFGASDRTLQVRTLPDWTEEVSRDSQRWFFAMHCNPTLKESGHQADVTRFFVTTLQRALVGNVSAWLVEGGSPGMESTDILFEDQEGYYLLRFSWYD